MITRDHGHDDDDDEDDQTTRILAPGWTVAGDEVDCGVLVVP